jgi:hypothetical protein
MKSLASATTVQVEGLEQYLQRSDLLWCILLLHLAGDDGTWLGLGVKARGVVCGQ